MRIKGLFFYISLMVLSAEIMLLEIVGAKALSPIFGSSHFVWMSQIIITLASLSVGSFFSSFYQSKTKDLEAKAYRALIIPATYILLSTMYFNKIVFSFLSLSLPVAALIASIILYFIPLAGISFTYSSITTEGLKRYGNESYGKISAIGTIGSLCGTFVFGYYLVQNFTNQDILISSAFSMWILSAIHEKIIRKTGKLSNLFPIILVFTFLSLYVGKEKSEILNYPRLLKSRNSPFGELIAIDDKEKIEIYNNNLIQGSFYKNSKKSAILFTHALSSLVVANAKSLNDVYQIGLGLGFVAKDLREYGAKKIETAEINEEFVSFSKDFGIYDEATTSVEIGDGRYSLLKKDKKYDVIIVDAFIVDNPPQHLNTKEFYELTKEKLNDNGILVINNFGFTSPPSLTTKSLKKTLLSVFTDVDAYSVNDGNVYFVASNKKLTSNINKILAEEMPNQIKPVLYNLISNKSLIDEAGGVLLTDSFNPIDSMDLQERERIRKQALSPL